MNALRNMTSDDLPMVLAWRNREDVRQNMYTNHVITQEEHMSWWARESVNPKSRLLIFEMDGSPSGVVVFTHYSGPQGLASWAFYSGDTTRRGVGPLMERAALTYAFETLKLRKLECEVLDFNMKVVKFHRRHGFSIEGVFRKAYERETSYHDIYRLAMLSDDWQRIVKQSDQPSLTGTQYKKRVHFTADLVDGFSAATGDRNKIHIDSLAAQQAGFPDRIAHGMLSGGLISAIFANEFPGPGTVYISQQLNFLVPITLGSEAEIKLQVISHVGRRLEIETQVVIDATVCISGEAVLLLPRTETQ